MSELTKEQKKELELIASEIEAEAIQIAHQLFESS